MPRPGDPELLAALALVVGARQEPAAGLRRLAAEDRGLRRLLPLAARLEQGQELSQALLASGWLRARDASLLTGLPPEALAAELGRHALRRTRTSWGAWAQRHADLLLVGAATLPSLALALAVLITGSGRYPGVLGLFSAVMFSWPPPRELPAWQHLLLHLLVIGLVGVVAVVTWRGFRRIPGLRWIGHGPRSLEQAARWAGLLRELRLGTPDGRRLEAWLDGCGGQGELRAAIATAGGDPVSALLALRIIPADGEGRPDWDLAIAEADREQERQGQHWQAWPLALAAVAGVIGFFAWNANILPPLRLNRLLRMNAPWLDHYAQQFVQLVAIVGGGLLSLHLARLLHALIPHSSPWPGLAQRLAGSLRLREDPAPALRGQHLLACGGWRRRLGRALADPEPHLGRCLARARLPPARQAHMLAAAEAPEIESLLTCASTPEPPPVLVHTRVLLLCLVLGAASALGLVAQAALSRYKSLSWKWDASAWTTHFDHALLAATIFSGAITTLLLLWLAAEAWARRRGWSLLPGGWSRLACGLVLRQQLLQRNAEPALAATVARLLPRAGRAASAAAAAGDLPRLLISAGLPARDVAGLDRLLDARLRRAQARHRRLATAMRCLLPVLLAPPIASWFFTVFLFQRAMNEQQTAYAASGPTGQAASGTIIQLLLQWQTEQAEAAAQAAVDAARPPQTPPLQGNDAP